MLADAEAALGAGIDEAVISVPAYFSEAQRKATRAAAELSGIRVDQLINKPTAAALAYGPQDRQAARGFLLLDLGGRTIDVSILELFDGREDTLGARARCGHRLTWATSLATCRSVLQEAP